MRTNLTYTGIMLLAIGVGYALSRRTQSVLPLPGWQRAAITMGAFCGAMLGAKLPFVLADWEGLVSGRAWFSDGKTICLGLVGGYFGVELTKWMVDVPIKTGDTFAVPVATAIGIGRLGCFVAGCCYGTQTHLPWGVDFGDGLRRHPTQVYELAFHLSAAVALAALRHDGLFRGQLIKLYIIAYFVYRFATEFIRPEPRLWGGLTGYQWAALAFVPLFALLWMNDARQVRGSAIAGTAG